MPGAWPINNSALLRNGCLVDGQWRSDAPLTLAIDNPASEQLIHHLPSAETEWVDDAITAAARALPAWSATTPELRAQLLERWAQLLLEHRDDLAWIMTAEQGKPLREATGEIDYSASYCRWFANQARQLADELLPAFNSKQHLRLQKQAVGVCALITPWNFPMAMLARKASAALAAGCTVVAKPASQTPLSALAFAYLGQQAGLPDGVLNVLTGASAVIGPRLCADTRIRKLSFTGSTAVGRQLMAACAPSLKRLSLELGGNAPLLVFADANLDLAVEQAVLAKFRNAGQTCVCVNRILVAAEIEQAFLQRFAERIGRLRVGDGLNQQNDVGPLIDQAAVAHMEALLADAIQGGASVPAGGARHALGGRFFQPTLVSGAHSEMRLWQEEIFGPLVAVMPFASETQAVALANASDYGLAAYVFTTDEQRALRVAQALEVGMVGINTGRISDAAAPFGGVKQSGFGREGSRYGLDEYLSLKTLTLGTP